MILDIARHKFYEALLVVALLALFGVVSSYLLADDVLAHATLATAPLQPLLHRFSLAHPALAAVLSFVLIVATSLRLTRSTIVHSLFQMSSLSTMSLSAVIILGLGLHGNILANLVVAYLASEALHRICYCVAPTPKLHYLFTAFMALGAMPLVDSSMLAPALVAPVVIMLSRKKPREVVVALLGLITPLFAYSYICWVEGSTFFGGFATIWQGMLTPSALADGNYLSLPRLIMLGAVAFVQICTSLIYFNDRLSISLISREIWKMLQTIVLLFTLCFVVLPSTTAASFLVVGLCISMMSPLLFTKFTGSISMTAFYLLLGIAVWSI